LQHGCADQEQQAKECRQEPEGLTSLKLK
jgi:hypothetical protein